jgi:DNA-binding HxlR family transcriptional regulator
VPHEPRRLCEAPEIVGADIVLVDLGLVADGQFHQRLGISRNILNQRLNRLVDHDVLDKVHYSERAPRHEYRLTAKGRDLWPILNAMWQWGDKHAAPNGPPLKMVHKACGKVTDAVLTCSRCGERISSGDVRAMPGPGDLDRVVESVVKTR